MTKVLGGRHSAATDSRPEMSFMTVGMGRLGQPIVVQPSPFNQEVQSSIQGCDSWDFIRHIEYAIMAPYQLGRIYNSQHRIDAP